MSYAIRNDKQGWWAVDGVGDVGADEYYSDEPIEIVANFGIPDKVTMRQARLALHAAGLLSQVEVAIEALPEPNRTVARIEWDYASEVHRASEFVTLLGAELELDKQSLDDLFLKAREL